MTESAAIRGGVIGYGGRGVRAPAERRAAFGRRLATDRRLTEAVALAEASHAGVELAPAYWPVLIASDRRDPDPSDLSAVERAAGARFPGSLAIRCAEREIVVLLADRAPGAARRPEVHAFVPRLVSASARAAAAGSGGHAFVAEQSVRPGQAATELSRLRGLRRYPRRSREQPVLCQRDYALDRLMSQRASHASVAAFVQELLGPVLAHDSVTGDEMARILELALDYPRRDAAARAACMHRNTFRRRLQRARKLLDVDWDDPDERLAVHVALKAAKLALRRA